VIGASLTGDQDAEKWFRHAHAAFEREIMEEVHDLGVSNEALLSTACSGFVRGRSASGVRVRRSHTKRVAWRLGAKAWQRPAEQSVAAPPSRKIVFSRRLQET
jgi:hypothetical protein